MFDPKYTSGDDSDQPEHVQSDRSVAFEVHILHKPCFLGCADVQADLILRPENVSVSIFFRVATQLVYTISGIAQTNY